MSRILGSSSPLTVYHYATFQSSGRLGYKISRSSWLSPVPEKSFSYTPIRAATTHLAPTIAQGSHIGDPAPLPVESNSSPKVIPDVSPHKGRSLVLCFDGTGEEYDNDYSNIVRFFGLLKKDDRSKQRVYYQAGIGTSVDPRKPKPWFPGLHKFNDTVFATGLGRHVRGGYEFLMQNYTEGDRISIFGYSRGAYIARALAGMIEKVGLLPAYNNAQVPYAYEMYKRDDRDGWTLSKGFKETFSVDVKVHFVGVFDTVSGVGIIPQKLPFAHSNSAISIFRHALALDERRAEFSVSLWGKSLRKKSIIVRFIRWILRPIVGAIKPVTTIVTRYWRWWRCQRQPVTQDNKASGGREHSRSIESGTKTDVREVWFAGAHGDVGGGSVSNDTVKSLAHIPLRWMIRECFKNDTGILFRSAELKKLGISPETLCPKVDIPILPTKETTDKADSGVAHQADDIVVGSRGEPPTGDIQTSITETQPNELSSAQRKEADDALANVHDKLVLCKWWWIPELLQTHWRHDLNNLFTTPPTFGSGRVIEEHDQDPTYVHRSVQYRMEKLKYEPRTRLPAKTQWVD